MVDASSIKKLRDRTGAGMMECKKALIEANGDEKEAIDWLRKKGLATAAKKAGRATAEGLVTALVEDNVGVAIEINTETDFLARNEKFQQLTRNITKLAIKANSLEELNSMKIDDKSVAETIVDTIALFGENISLRRMGRVKIDQGIIASYIHNSVAEKLGQIAIIVGLESKADQAKLMELGEQIAMHIAAADPQALRREDLDPALIEREHEIFTAQAKATGQSDKVIEQMVKGRIAKFFEEAVLLEQIFVLGKKLKISEIVENAAKELGSPITITGFIRYEVGEGIAQQETNFAAEVAAVLKS